MVNMYSMGNMMNYNINPTSQNPASSVNVHQNLKNKYGVGYEDFGVAPYAQPYPVAIIARNQETPFQRSWIGRFLNKFGV